MYFIFRVGKFCLIPLWMCVSVWMYISEWMCIDVYFCVDIYFCMEVRFCVLLRYDAHNGQCMERNILLLCVFSLSTSFSPYCIFEREFASYLLSSKCLYIFSSTPLLWNCGPIAQYMRKNIFINVWISFSYFNGRYLLKYLIAISELQ